LEENFLEKLKMKLEKIEKQVKLCQKSDETKDNDKQLCDDDDNDANYEKILYKQLITELKEEDKNFLTMVQANNNDNDLITVSFIQNYIIIQYIFTFYTNF